MCCLMTHVESVFSLSDAVNNLLASYEARAHSDIHKVSRKGLVAIILMT